MASRLRPTPETGNMPATQQRAQSIGPSWSARGGRNARLAMRDAIRSGDRAGAMQIATFAEEKGLPAQASIGSAESRMASSYLRTGSEAAKQAEMGAALDAGQTEEPAATTGQSRTAANMLARPDMGGAGPRMPASQTPAGADYNQGGMIGMVMDSARQNPVFREKAGAARAAYERIKDRGIDPKTGRLLVDESEVGPSIPEQPPAPGATPPPENPVSGSSVPPVSDVRTRLSQRSSFAPQGLAGRQAFDANLKKSLEVGGNDISEGRFANMQKEATRLGISKDQLLTRLQDIGTFATLPTSASAPTDTRSLDQRLQSYQDEYLGGGTAAELPGKLREDAASNRTAAEGLARARASSERARVAAEREVAADAEGSRRRTEGLMTPGATGSPDPNLVSGFQRPTPAPVAPTSGPLAAGQTPSVLKRMTERGRERIRGTAFEDSGGYKAAAATEEFLTGTLPNAAENTKRRAKALAQATGRKAAAGSRAVLRRTEGTAFEGTDAYNALKRFLTR